MERNTVDIIGGKESGERVFEAQIVFPDGNRFDVTVSDPFLQEGEIEPHQEERLRWYFEEFLNEAFSSGEKSNRAAQSIFYYGESLFNQLFVDPQALAQWRGLAMALEPPGVRVISRDAPFHALHWEALKDPLEKKSYCLMDMEIIRSSGKPTNTRPIKQSSSLNLLMVAARPGGKEDIEYRTITRPVVETLEENRMPVCVHLLRPPTLAELKDHLRSRKGFYHIVHFDVHGAVLPGKKKGETRAFILLHHPEGGADPVPAEEIAGLLREAHVPVCFLNACQSSAPTVSLTQNRESGERPFVLDASLAMALLEHDVRLVLGMGWSLTVSAARLMMPVLYGALTGGGKPGTALNRARRALGENNQRHIGGGQAIELHDWLLPIVWGKGDFSLALELKPRAFDEVEADLEQKERREQLEKEMKTSGDYGFLGRDVDILTLEGKLLEPAKGANILLIRGMGGTGKSTLLGHMALWWLKTGWLDFVFYFPYDRKPYGAEEILNTVAEAIMPRDQYGAFLARADTGKKAFLLADFLKHGQDTPRVLLMLDNMESITGAEQAVGQRLDKDEQKRLALVIKRLMQSSIKILLGSRAPEEWLGKETFKDRVYPLEGLDQASRYTLARAILEKEGIAVTDWPGFQRLMEVLAGYPLAMEIILPNLARQEPQEMVKLLTGAGVDLKGGEISEAIFKCIHISFSLLTEKAQSALSAFSPFTGFLNARNLEYYLKLLHGHGGFTGLTLADLEEVLAQAQTQGLMQEKFFEGCYVLQPVLPFFLGHRAAQPGLLSEAERQALDRAFCDYMTELAKEYNGLMESKAAEEKQAGLLLFKMERENLEKALSRVLEEQGDFHPLYNVFGYYYHLNPAYREAINWMEGLVGKLDGYAVKEKDFLGNYALVVTNLGTQYFSIRAYDRAGEHYEKSLSLFLQAGKRQNTATVYHQLGYVAFEQRDFQAATGHYNEALKICKEYKDRYSQARTYHQLGMVAEEQWDFQAATGHYNEALKIFKEFNDRYSQASTYHQLGYVAQEQRDFQAATGHYNEALKIWKDFNDRYSQAVTYHQLGMVAEDRRDFQAATGHYNEALKICKEFEDRYSQARTYHQLGIVAQEQRDFQAAIGHYNEALKIKKEYNDRYSQARTYVQLGRVAKEENDFTRALNHFAVALEIFNEFKDEYSLKVVINNLKNLFQAWDAGEARQAVEELDVAEETKKILIDNC
jgi:tetratricopeptide (TPR) repeat protein